MNELIIALEVQAEIITKLRVEKAQLAQQLEAVSAELAEAHDREADAARHAD